MSLDMPKISDVDRGFELLHFPVYEQRNGCLNAVDEELKTKRTAREALVPPVIQLPEDLPDLYRAMMDDLVSALSAEGIASRASDALHELIERVVVHWDAEAAAHRLEIEGDLLEIMRKSAPAELGAVRDGSVFAEVGCGGRI